MAVSVEVAGGPLAEACVWSVATPEQEAPIDLIANLAGDLAFQRGTDRIAKLRAQLVD